MLRLFLCPYTMSDLILTEKLKEHFKFDKFERFISNDFVQYLKRFIDVELELRSLDEEIALDSDPSFVVQRKCNRCPATDRVIMDIKMVKNYCKIQNSTWRFSPKWLCPECEQVEVLEIIKADGVGGATELLSEYLEIGRVHPNSIKNKSEANMSLLVDMPVFYQNKLCELIKSMDYSTFLRTKYWQYVSFTVKYNNINRCLFCGGRDDLESHHKTYIRHGMEHVYWESDLIPLCRVCHQKEHSK
jgi:HNH endonuclease